MDYTKYKKSVVVLKEQSKDFALEKGHPVTGYVKLETGENRGAVRVGAENLKESGKDNYIYKLILFGKYKEKNIYKVLGGLPIGKDGKGESYLNFNPKDMDGKGNPLDHFNVALLVAVSQSNLKEPLHPILRGSLIANEEEPPKGKIKKYNDYYNHYILTRCNTMAGRKDRYDRILPFKEDQTNAEWLRVSGANKFPVVSPDTQYILSKYRHFIFGIGKNHYYLGVPGRYLEKEQPEGGKSGFTLWQPIIGAENLNAKGKNAPIKNRQAAYGYWIMTINKETGMIEEFKE